MYLYGLKFNSIFAKISHHETMSIDYRCNYGIYIPSK